MNNFYPKLPNYRPDIDGIRAIAVLAVVLFHFFPEIIQGGFIGVDIFFVISGYLITGIILSDQKLNNFSFINFYARRALRIFPALLLVLCSVLILGWIVLLAEEYQILGKHIAVSSIFIPNLIYWFEDGYFDKLAETKLLLHLWSLGIEEQFYLIWPLILWLGWRLRLNLSIIILMTCALSFYWNIRVADVDKAYDFFSPMTRFWELLIGALLALNLARNSSTIFNKKVYEELPPSLARYFLNNQGLVQNISSYLGSTLILVGLFSITKSNDYPGYYALLPIMGSALLIYGGPASSPNKYLLSNRILVALGLISYPLYLWHWPLLSFVRIVLGFEPPLTIKFILLIISIFLSFLTYKFLEIPIKGLSKNIKNYVAIFLSLLLALVGLTGYHIEELEGLKSRPVVIKSNNIEKQFSWDFMSNDICLKKYSLTEKDLIKFRFCMLEKQGEPTVILLGNSYANQLYPGLISMDEFKAENVLSIGACNPVEPDGDADYIAPPGHPCFGNGLRYQQDFIDNIIQQSGAVKFVIMGGLVEKPNRIYIERLEERIRKIQSMGAEVIIVNPHIRPKFGPYKCSSRPYKFIETNCTFSKSLIEESNNRFKPLVDSISKSNPSVKFFNPNDIYCNMYSCSFVHDGLPLNRDLGHLSTYGSEVLAKNFIDWAKINAPKLLKSN